MTGQLDILPVQTIQVGEIAFTLRDVLPGDMAAVLALHTHVFGPDVDACWFEWKYGQSANQGHGQASGVWQGDELVAYCGGIPRTLWQDHKSINGLQMGDVMVHPAWRGILTRRGPFFHVTQSFHNSRLGPKNNKPFQLGFGFPNARHLRLGVMLGLFRDSGAIECLHWSPSTKPAQRLPWKWRFQALSPSQARFDRSIDNAWQSMAASCPGLMLGQRNAAYLRWRYADRPTPNGTSGAAQPRYQFFELFRPWSSVSSGVAVMDLRATSAHWLDWVGPLELMPLACMACRHEAARAGASALTAWSSSAVAHQLEGTDIIRRDVCAGLAVSAASDLEPEDVPGIRWWLMGGDTDFL